MSRHKVDLTGLPCNYPGCRELATSTGLRHGFIKRDGSLRQYVCDFCDAHSAWPGETTGHVYWGVDDGYSPGHTTQFPVRLPRHALTDEAAA